MADFIHLVEFEPLKPDYYMCKECKTHVALREDLTTPMVLPVSNFQDLMQGMGLLQNDPPYAGKFSRVVNVQISPQHRQISPHETIADIHCTKCGNILGWRHIQVVSENTAEQKIVLNLNIKNLLERKNIIMERDQIDGGEITFPDYYKCKACGTHIALAEDYTVKEFLEDKGPPKGTFRNIVNVRIADPAQNSQPPYYSTATIFCITCNDALGWSYNQLVDKNGAIHNNVLRLLMEKLEMKHSQKITCKNANKKRKLNLRIEK